MSEVSKHDSVENRVWVTFRNGVYDITDFIPLHPGANKLLMAAGGSVEPFWAMYGFHLKQQVIHSMLEEYRIGNLDLTDVESQKETMADSSDPYAADPKRHPALVINNPRPFNAETPLSIITDSFITPNELFYVRNHLPVPEVDLSSYELEVGIGDKELVMSLDDLKTKFAKHTITATIQCGGNRRAEMLAVKKLKGLQWRGGAIGTATWSGARLSDVLLAAGLTEETAEGHIIFEGLDVEPDGSLFSASIPVEKAFDPRGDVLLAYEMNGEPLPRDHGFPLRAVVPGTIGVRNVKWVHRITLSETESDSLHQTRDYKGFSPSIDWSNVAPEWDKAASIQEMPVTSSICSPSAGAEVKRLPDGTVRVSGYAWSGGGRKILRVDLTSDGGKTWTTADIVQQDEAKHPRHWAWTLWEGSVPAPAEGGPMEVWSKAVDSSYNVQPESFLNIWNLRGVLSNAYCRLKLTVEK